MRATSGRYVLATARGRSRYCCTGANPPARGKAAGPSASTGAGHAEAPPSPNPTEVPGCDFSALSPERGQWETSPSGGGGFG